jgi:type I restriction enzyme S subunit
MEGYKDSLLGKIPIDWEIFELNEIGEFKNGINKGKEDFGHGFPMVNLSDVFGVSTVKNENLGLVNSTPNERVDYDLKQGDVLFIRSSVKPSGVGLTAVINEDLKDTVYSGFIIRFRDNNFLDLNFKKHCFYDAEFRNRLLAKSSVSANTNINQKSLNSLTLLVPPLPEQQKIAEILSTVDAKIEVIDQQITETQALKKGLMQRLLTKGIGHKEFKDSALGAIPKSWEVKDLGEISEIKGRIGYRGYTKADLVEKGQGALALGGAQIDKQNKLKLTQPVYLTWEKYEESPEIKITEGDIIFAQRGTLGRTALINSLTEPATINPSMVLIKNIKCSNKLLYYYLCSSHVQDAVAQISTSTAVPMISQKQIKEFKIGIPPIEEQTKIAEILSSVDDKLEVLSEKKTHYQELKQGLMQQLLTGKIRVNNLIAQV